VIPSFLDPMLLWALFSFSGPFHVLPCLQTGLAPVGWTQVEVGIVMRAQGWAHCQPIIPHTPQPPGPRPYVPPGAPPVVPPPPPAPHVVPEPRTVALLVAGLAALVVVARRRRA
jgi:hypothetical protein